MRGFLIIHHGLYQAFELSYFTHFYHFYPFRNISHILSRDNNTSKSELLRFYNTFLKKIYIFYHSCKRHFSEKNRTSQSLSRTRTHHRRDTGEINTRLCERKPPSNIQIYIVIFKLYLREFAHHGNKKIDFSLGNSTRRSFRISEFRIRCERFNFYKNRTIPFYHKRKGRSRKCRILRINEFQSRIRNIYQS